MPAKSQVIQSAEAVSPQSDSKQVTSLETTPIWEIAARLGAEIPPDERASVPHDGARNFKHYLYGASQDS